MFLAAAALLSSTSATNAAGAWTTWFWRSTTCCSGVSFLLRSPRGFLESQALVQLLFDGLLRFFARLVLRTQIFEFFL